jgi:hypothetical protein
MEVMNKMKKTYKKPEVEIIALEAEDITTSGLAISSTDNQETFVTNSIDL